VALQTLRHRQIFIPDELQQFRTSFFLREFQPLQTVLALTPSNLPTPLPEAPVADCLKHFVDHAFEAFDFAAIKMLASRSLCVQTRLASLGRALGPVPKTP
jgi:hypothetical protein